MFYEQPEVGSKTVTLFGDANNRLIETGFHQMVDCSERQKFNFAIKNS
jgi:hypothetical protein